jgi:predicted pyridoxine 5'-phosphate oxidase superfamily flavin-nucleotide-binding protein
MLEHVIPNPFHEGELRAQQLAGVELRPGRIVPIRDRMPDQHRAFFPLLPFLCMAAADADGWPLATLVQGAPGFVTSPDDTRLRIGALPPDDDPVRAHLAPGAPVGLLGIDLATRRRNRANGVIEAFGDEGLDVRVAESFGNCPRYITVRRLEPVARARAPEQVFASEMPTRARRMIEACGTLFVASSSAAGRLDISHRGGPPGFVRVDGAVLRVPDYAGNRYYNTLGNFLVEPRAAIVLADFASGDMLQLQGRVEVDWSAADGREDPPAERSWRFTVTRGVLRPGAFGLGETAAPA